MRILILSALWICLFAIPASAEISGNFYSGAVRIGPTPLNCDGTTKGAIRYDETQNLHEYCNGTIWRQFSINQGSGGPPSEPVDGDGYFVVTNGTWNGNLGGLPGADAKCLSDLTNNDWMGKADAISRGMLANGNIHAFQCAGSACNSAMANVKYFFAVSGDPAAGGAHFTTDGTGLGPGNTQNWSGSNYFNGAKNYWSVRENVSTSLWTNTSSGGNGNNKCNNWASSSADYPTFGGNIGQSNSIGISRWNSSPVACDSQRRLVCFVHP